jgi:serine/threonine protein kinase
VRADIWSLGITLIEVVLGFVPYRDKKGNIPTNIILLQNLIINLDVEDLVNKTLTFSEYKEDAREFLKLCLSRIEQRPKYDILMKTKFYLYYQVYSNKKVEQWIQLYYENKLEEVSLAFNNVSYNIKCEMFVCLFTLSPDRNVIYHSEGLDERS